MQLRCAGQVLTMRRISVILFSFHDKWEHCPATHHSHGAKLNALFLSITSSEEKLLEG